tara:strand:+ start:170 stop:1303 length:1134 start_codon:yes stop_codon:yes gene_type:complete
MKKRIFNTPFSRSIVPGFAWKDLTKETYNDEKLPTVLPNRGNGRLLETRTLKSKGDIPSVQGSSEGIHLRRLCELLKFNGQVRVRCCNKLHTLELKPDFSLESLNHDDLDSLKMLQSFGAEEHLRCLTVTNAWNSLLNISTHPSGGFRSYDIDGYREELPKILRTVWDHVFGGAKIRHTKRALTQLREMDESHRYKSWRANNSFIIRMESRGQKELLAYADNVKAFWLRALCGSQRGFCFTWYKEVFVTGLNKVYLLSDIRNFQHEQKFGKDTVFEGKPPLPFPIIGAYKTHDWKKPFVVYCPDFSGGARNLVRHRSHLMREHINFNHYRQATVERFWDYDLGDIFILDDVNVSNQDLLKVSAISLQQFRREAKCGK